MEISCPHCGSIFGKKGKARSLPQHRRLFAIINAAFDNWPDDHEFRPDSPDHLRAYLICSAGPNFRTPTEIKAPYAEEQPALTRLVALSIESAIKAAGGYAFIRPHPDGGSVAVYKAKSIKFHLMPHLEFCALTSAIDDQLLAIGLDPEKLAKAEAIAA